MDRPAYFVSDADLWELANCIAQNRYGHFNINDYWVKRLISEVKWWRTMSTKNGARPFPCPAETPCPHPLDEHEGMWCTGIGCFCGHDKKEEADGSQRSSD